MINMKEKKSFVLRYGILDSGIIFNYSEPGYRVPTVSKEEKSELQNKFIENRNKRDNFYNDLEKSILTFGIKNPVILQAGWVSDTVWNNLPIEIKNKGMENLLICITNGGSRLYMAKKHNLQVPCLIIDYVNRFKDLELLQTVSQIKKVFSTPPKHIIIKEGKPMFMVDEHGWKKNWNIK